MDKQEYTTKIVWLRRYRQAIGRADRTAQRLAEAKSAAMRITPSFSSVRCQSRDGVSGTQRSIERIEELESRLLTLREECAGLYRETLRAILTLEHANERMVLRRRYLQGMPMEGIAGEMGITERQARRIHRAAIRYLQCPP